jgi:hypothetical protein
MNHRSLVGTIVLCLIPAALAGQDSSPSRLEDLKPGQRVRLLTIEGHRLEGRLDSITHQPPALHLHSLDQAIAVAIIDSLWIHRTHAGKGAWIGALVLGIPSAIFWTGICSAVSEGQGCDAVGVVTGLTLAGAAVGAGGGALIGSTSTRWELRYVRTPVSSRWWRPREPQLHLGLRLRLP